MILTCVESLMETRDEIVWSALSRCVKRNIHASEVFYFGGDMHLPNANFAS